MRVLCVAPHADDEALGCGGTLLRFRQERPAMELHWVLATEMTESAGYRRQQIEVRDREIESVSQALGTADVHRLGFPVAELDRIPVRELVASFSAVITAVKPEVVLVPFRHDVHTDHRAVFDGVIACTKTFRYPFVRTLLAYETPSETDFAIDPSVAPFRPNVWINISDFLEAKIELIGQYRSEMGEFPFPRSREAVTALARVRGSAAGVHAAEAFMLLKGLL